MGSSFKFSAVVIYSDQKSSLRQILLVLLVLLAESAAVLDLESGSNQYSSLSVSRELRSIRVIMFASTCFDKFDNFAIHLRCGVNLQNHSD